MLDLEKYFINGAARALFVTAWADREDLKCRSCDFDGNKQHDGSSIEGAHEMWLLVSDKEVHPFRTRLPQQQDLTDAAPETPDYVVLEAARLLGKFENANGLNIVAIMAAAARAIDAETARKIWPDEPEKVDRRSQLDDDDVFLFGHYIAMEAMGHGVSWFDDHTTFKLPEGCGRKPRTGSPRYVDGPYTCADCGRELAWGEGSCSNCTGRLVIPDFEFTSVDLED